MSWDDRGEEFKAKKSFDRAARKVERQISDYRTGQYMDERLTINEAIERLDDRLHSGRGDNHLRGTASALERAAVPRDLRALLTASEEIAFTARRARNDALILELRKKERKNLDWC